MDAYPGNQPSERTLDTNGLADVKFGREIREKEFLLDPKVSFLNHGSYGTVPRRVLDLQTQYNHERERHPDFWFRLNCKNYVDRTRQAVADFIGAELDNIVIVDNATTAINTVIKSYPFESGDAILDTTLTYGSIHRLCGDFTSRLRSDVERVKLELYFPLDEETIIKKYEEVFQKHPNIKVAVIDHITSPSAILMPIKRLTEICHKNGALAIIDGAHAIGQLPLNMKELKADIYTSNLHKWAFAPRGAAFLWFGSDHADWVRPQNTSWEIGKSLDLQFIDQGTRDHVPSIAALHGLEFIKAIGGMEKIVKYTSDLAEQAKEYFIKELDLKPLAIPPSLESPNLKLIKLPKFKNYPCTEEGFTALMKAMFAGSNVFGILVLIDGDIYLRYSIQVYNDFDDVKAIVELFREFIQNNI